MTAFVGYRMQVGASAKYETTIMARVIVAATVATLAVSTLAAVTFGGGTPAVIAATGLAIGHATQTKARHIEAGVAGIPIGPLELDTAFADLTRDTRGRAHVVLGGRDESIELWMDESYGYVQIFTGDGWRKPGVILETVCA